MDPSPVAVSPAWLANHLQDPQVVIVDCRFALMQPEWGRQHYQVNHIPGAYYLDLNQDLAGPVQPHGGRHPLPDLNLLAHTLNKMGITANTLVVSYDSSQFAFAARLWWLLRYMGHTHVAVLDGGWQAYQAAGYPVTTDVPPPRPGALVVNVQAHQVVDVQTVNQRKQLPGVMVVDSRDRDRYEGHREPIDPIAGHIPGAVNAPWKQITDEKGWLRSASDLQAHWEELGITQTTEMIVYCGSGVTACVNLLGLATAGYQGQLYAGSWSDWCSYSLDPNWNIQLKT